jgi:hypothetical protein
VFTTQSQSSRCSRLNSPRLLRLNSPDHPGSTTPTAELAVNCTVVLGNDNLYCGNYHYTKKMYLAEKRGYVVGRDGEVKAVNALPTMRSKFTTISLYYLLLQAVAFSSVFSFHISPASLHLPLSTLYKPPPKASIPSPSSSRADHS